MILKEKNVNICHFGPYLLYPNMHYPKKLCITTQAISVATLVLASKYLLAAGVFELLRQVENGTLGISAW